MNRIAWVVLLLASCAPNGDEANRVREVVQGLITADNESDLEGIVNAYTIDARLDAPTGMSIIGREAIRRHYQGLFETHKLHVNIQIEELRAASDIAFCAGTTGGRLIQLRDSTITLINDRFLMVLRHEDRWRISRLIWNAQLK